MTLFVEFYPQGSQAPVVTGTGTSWVKQGQSNERDGGSDGERSNEAHEEANEARETNKHLQEGSHHDGSLQLGRDTSTLTVRTWHHSCYKVIVIVIVFETEYTIVISLL